MKYLVMECHEDYAVLLDEAAGFVKAVNTGLEVGETIENPQLMKNTIGRSRIIMKVTATVAAIAACMGIVFGINRYQQYMTPYSYITLSINPDVEMELNRYGQVLSLEGLNEDGETLIKGYDPDRQDKVKVSDDLIDRAIEMGFLSDGATVIFEIDTPDDKLFSQYGMELRSETEVHTKNVSQVEIVIRHKDEEDDNADDYDESDYDPIVVTIPTQSKTESESVPSTTAAPSEDTDYSDDNEGVTDYGNTSVSTAVPTNPPTQASTAPPATAPPAVSGDSGYESGDSNYAGASNYGDSLYDN